MAPSWRTRLGSVTFTIVTSMLMISAARHSAKRINPLCSGARDGVRDLSQVRAGVDSTATFIGGSSLQRGSHRLKS